MAKVKLKVVTRFTNGMVMVFGEDGQQMPEYQGQWSEVAEKIRAAADEDTTFDFLDWNTEVRPFLNTGLTP